MSSWICQKCGWENAGKWEKCAQCGSSKYLSPEEIRLIEERPERLNKLIFSTTQYIEGANIDKYLGIVSGVVVLGAGIFSELDAGVADMLGIRSTMFQSKLEKARTAALNELSKSAVDKGANAVVGIDINYLGLGSNTLMVSANGTAVSFSKKV